MLWYHHAIMQVDFDDTVGIIDVNVQRSFRLSV